MRIDRCDRRAVTDAIDALVEQILDDCAVTAPPVDALDITKQIGIGVALDASQPVRGRHKRLGGTSAIFLKPDERPERLQWAAGHELGEVLAWRIFEMAAVEPEPAAREQVANLTASRLLLPEIWFPRDVQTTDADLLELKQAYSTASHELIAMRLLELPQPSIVTVFDHGSITRRRSSSGAAPPIQPLERQCQTIVHSTGSPCERSEARFTVRSWPVHEIGWKREILRTTPTDADF